MYIIADNNNKRKFEKEIEKTPFHKIKNLYIFKDYSELDEFFRSVKEFNIIQNNFLQEKR